jgi:hypothetical protein
MGKGTQSHIIHPLVQCTFVDWSQITDLFVQFVQFSHTLSIGSHYTYIVILQHFAPLFHIAAGLSQVTPYPVHFVLHVTPQVLCALLLVCTVLLNFWSHKITEIEIRILNYLFM